MPNDTVVQYILNVDSQTAERGLDRTAKEAGQTVQSFEKLTQASTRTTAGLKATGRQANETQTKMRGLRRAGRDLDGALMDLGQGISLINPAMGNLIMNLSDGASIAEGFGRIGSLFVNPMFRLMGTIVATLGLAFVAFNMEQEKAKKEAEELAKEIEAANKSFDDQIDILDKVNSKMADYITQVNDASIDLQLLTGAISTFELAQDQATLKAEKFRVGAKGENQKQLDALFKQIQATEILIKNKQNEFNEEKKNTAAYISKNKQLTIQGQALNDQLEALKLQRDNLRSQFKEAQNYTKEIDKQADEIEKLGLAIAENAEKERKRAAGKTRTDKQEAERQKRIEAIRKRVQEAESAAQKDRERSTNALQKLLQIENSLLMQNATEEEKILNSYRLAVEQVHELGDVLEDQVLTERVLSALKDQMKNDLDEINQKEGERVDLIKDQAQEAQKLFNVVNSTINAIQSPEAFVGGLGGILGGIDSMELFGADKLGFGAASPAISAAGSALTGIAGLGGSVQAEIDRSIVEARSQAIDKEQFDLDLESGKIPNLVLDEKQAQDVVLGNMQKAFDDFLRDLERGLELLPEILIRVLPEFTASLIKVIQVDLARVLIFELPVAIAAGIVMAIPAMINEIGFLFADVVNSMSFLFDELRSFLSGDRARRSKEERQAGRKEFRQQAFPGIQAAIESVQNFAGGGSFIPHAAGGMRFTGSSRQGLAMLHQNEFVVPASGQRPQSVDRQMSSMGGGVNITVNGTIVEQNAIDALVRKIEERFNSNYGLASSNLFGGR